MLIDILGMQEINRQIQTSGLKNTLLSRYMMDESVKKSGIDNFTSAASIHFFAACSNVNIPNDLLLGGSLHSHDFIVNHFEVKDGFVTVPITPGLGIEVDESIFK